MNILEYSLSFSVVLKLLAHPNMGIYINGYVSYSIVCEVGARRSVLALCCPTKVLMCMYLTAEPLFHLLHPPHSYYVFRNLTIPYIKRQNGLSLPNCGRDPLTGWLFMVCHIMNLSLQWVTQVAFVVVAYEVFLSHEGPMGHQKIGYGTLVVFWYRREWVKMLPSPDIFYYSSVFVFDLLMDNRFNT